MNYTTENIILKSLSGKNPAEEASVDELIDITNKYPAFGAAKYLAAKKMKQAQHENYEKYAQNAILYFPNPFWFHFKLNEEDLIPGDTFLPKKEMSKNTAQEKNVESQSNGVQIPPPENEPDKTKVAVAAERLPAEVKVTLEEPVSHRQEYAVAQDISLETVVSTGKEEQPAEHIETTKEEAINTSPAAEHDAVVETAVEEEHPAEQGETLLPQQPAEHILIEAALADAKEEHPVEQEETQLPEQPMEQAVPVEAVFAEAKEEHPAEQEEESPLPEQTPGQDIPVEAVLAEAKEQHPVEQEESPLPEQPTEQTVPVEADLAEAEEERAAGQEEESPLPEQPPGQDITVEAVLAEAKEQHPVEQEESPLPEQPTEQTVPVEAVFAEAKEQHPAEQEETLLPEQPIEQTVPVEGVLAEAKEQHSVEQEESPLPEQPTEQTVPVEADLAETKEEHLTEQEEMLLPEETSVPQVKTQVPPGEYIPKLTGFERAEDMEDGGDFEDADTESETTAPPFNNERIISVLQEQLADFKKPVAGDTPVPVETEPYHTIDYFASQGIKLTLEQQSQDHLSVKVKKFTDWLKQMKRINPAPADLGIDEAAEHRVQNIAAGSNEPKEVVTEAMAEVLAKQGMTEKAIQVYIKLSFLYPSKSAYFATQIEQLKGI